MHLTKYHDKISAVCPIISIRNQGGVLSFVHSPSATPEQIQAATDLLTTFNIDADQQKEATFKAFIEAGYSVGAPFNFVIPFDDSTRNLMSGLGTMIHTALDLGLKQSSDQTTLQGVSMTYGQARTILLGYGNAYKTAYDASL